MVLPWDKFSSQAGALPSVTKKKAGLANRNYGEDQSFQFLQSEWDGQHNVRLMTGEKDIGLATTAQSYALSNMQKAAAAERIAALWNLAAAFGWATEDIKRMSEAI